ILRPADGALWRSDDAGKILALRPPGSRVNRIALAPGQQKVYAGYANGDVIAIDILSWQHDTILHASGAIQAIALTSDGQTIAIASNDGVIHVRALTEATAATWMQLQARARDIALTADGVLVAPCTDGTIWLYSLSQHRWFCLPTGTVDFGKTAVTADGKIAVTLDREGRLLWLDL